MGKAKRLLPERRAQPSRAAVEGYKESLAAVGFRFFQKDSLSALEQLVSPVYRQPMLDGILGFVRAYRELEEEGRAQALPPLTPKIRKQMIVALRAMRLMGAVGEARAKGLARIDNVAYSDGQLSDTRLRRAMAILRKLKISDSVRRGGARRGGGHFLISDTRARDLLLYLTGARLEAT